MIYFWQCGESLRGHEQQREAARTLLLAALRAEYGRETLPQIISDENGKPHFDDGAAAFNYSHCRGAVLCGLSAEAIGVDIEPARPCGDRLAKYICAPRELELLQQYSHKEAYLIKLWVLKESFLKFTGQGLRIDPKQLDMSDVLNACETSGEAVVYRTDEMPGTIGTATCFMRLWECSGYYLAACAARCGDLELKETVH